MNAELEMRKCTTFMFLNTGRCIISCKLGLWSVEGPYGMSLIEEANRYYQLYKADGEYDEILGENL